MDLLRSIDSAQLSGFHYRVLAISSLIYALTAMDVMLIAALVRPIAVEWSLDVITVGYLLSIGYLGMFVGALACGRLADAIGRRKTIVIVLLIESIFTASCGLAEDLYTLAVLRLIAGIGLGGALPQPGVYVSEYTPVKHRGTFLGIVETSWVYGAILSLLIPYYMLPVYGWRATFFVALAPVALIPLVLTYLPESVRYLLKRGDVGGVKAVLAKMGLDVTVNVGVEGHSVKKYTIKDLFSKKYASRTALLFILWASLVYTYHGIFVWLPSIYAKEFGLTEVTSIWWVLLVTLFQIPGYYSATFLLDRIGRRKVLAIYLVLAGVASALLSVYVELTWVFVWSAAISFFNLGAWAGLYAYTPELYPTEIRGTGAGASASVGRIAGILAPTLTGYLYASFKLTGPFVAFSLVHVLAGVATVLLGIETMGRSLEEISE